MYNTRLLYLLFSIVIFLSVAACGPSLVLHNVDYSQPIESVLEADADLNVHDQRFAVKFSIAPLLADEGVSGVTEIRMIRNQAGYYFVTASGFNNVYIFAPGVSNLELVEKIMVSSNGLIQPAFNQRGSYIELIDRDTGETFNLNYEN